MLENPYIDISTDGSVIAINVSAQDELMEHFLQPLITRLCETFSLIYYAADPDLTAQRAHFGIRATELSDKNAVYPRKQSPRALVVSELTPADAAFLAENWNGSSQRTDRIVAGSLLSEFDFTPAFFNQTPRACLKDENISFVITDGDNPDAYSAFAIYLRKENFSQIRDCVADGIEKIVQSSCGQISPCDAKGSIPTPTAARPIKNSRKIHLVLILLTALLLIGAIVFFHQPFEARVTQTDLKAYAAQFHPENNYLPAAGYIPDAKTAQRIGSCMIDAMTGNHLFGSVDIAYDAENRLWKVNKAYLFHRGGFIIIEQDTGRVVKALLNK